MENELSKKIIHKYYSTFKKRWKMTMTENGGFIGYLVLSR